MEFIMKKICISLIIASILLLFCDTSAMALYPREKDIIPKVGEQTDQLYWKKYKIPMIRILGSKMRQ